MRDSITDWYHFFCDDEALVVEGLSVESKPVIIKIETELQLNILKWFRIFLIYVIWCIEIELSITFTFMFK